MRQQTDFLREGLTPLLHRHGCGAVIMHHTPKTQFNPSVDFTTTDFMYRGAGCASMTNWARAYLVFEPVNEKKLFRFVAAKRGQRIGWESTVRFYRHSRVPGEIKWLQASNEEVDAAVTKKSNALANGTRQLDLDKVFALIPVVDEVERKLLIHEVASKFQVGEKKATTAIDLIEAQGRVARNYRFADNCGNKGGRKSIFLSRNDDKREVARSCEQPVADNFQLGKEVSCKQTDSIEYPLRATQPTPTDQLAETQKKWSDSLYTDGVQPSLPMDGLTPFVERLSKNGKPERQKKQDQKNGPRSNQRRFDEPA